MIPRSTSEVDWFDTMNHLEPLSQSRRLGHGRTRGAIYKRRIDEQLVVIAVAIAFDGAGRAASVC